MKGEARTTVNAPADRLWSMVSDVTRMGEWSPETHRCEWVDGATGPAVGAKFKGANRLGVARWSTTPKVTECEPGRVFAFDTGSTLWRYQFNDRADGTSTEVVESFETHGPALLELAYAVVFRERQLQKGLERTLRSLKTAAESST
ncbi:MAG: hypothetical protein QOI20_3168 [Acidimicrobiaceae bacterium]|jgi:hypothetical protein|nr:hypothetical protein [Acidimicrobiaceae bacterium]